MMMMTRIGIFTSYIINIPEVLTSINKSFQTDKMCTILFYEQAVYKRGTKW